MACNTLGFASWPESAGSMLTIMTNDVATMLDWIVTDGTRRSSGRFA